MSEDNKLLLLNIDRYIVENLKNIFEDNYNIDFLNILNQSLIQSTNNSVIHHPTGKKSRSPKSERYDTSFNIEEDFFNKKIKRTKLYKTYNYLEKIIFEKTKKIKNSTFTSRLPHIDDFTNTSVLVKNSDESVETIKGLVETESSSLPRSIDLIDNEDKLFQTWLLFGLNYVIYDNFHNYKNHCEILENNYKEKNIYLFYIHFISYIQNIDIKFVYFTVQKFLLRSLNDNSINGVLITRNLISKLPRKVVNEMYFTNNIFPLKQGHLDNKNLLSFFQKNTGNEEIIKNKPITKHNQINIFGKYGDVILFSFPYQYVFEEYDDVFQDIIDSLYI